MPVKLLVIGVPESGLEEMYSLMPQLLPLSKGTWVNQWEGDVQDELLKLKPGEIRTGYLYHSETVKRFMDAQRIRRIFMVRDPRDMILSMLFSILRDPKHPHQTYFRQHLKSMNERLLRMITGFMESRAVSKQFGEVQIGYGDINEHYNRYLRWMDDPGTLTVRYEKAADDPKLLHEELARIVDYLWPDLQDGERTLTKEQYIQRIGQLKPEKPKHILPPGGWKKAYTPETIAAFKKVAGELLIYLGYEQDFDW
ncbi:hypothetical protein EHV15_00850 [Paenibacillus oralis]|uniref:Sulfotransferase domain-containing protein n=1 Tax=Paenibacillus oralis TaxID=2490856 RepID=A0A3P3TU55_9BACL|nr:sulfotransferase domain-containing protein [Paenibacillus oralis]RRJ61681.1 hypothetical protein EHV15_00850 [Paenibacillus oralis]